MLYLNHNNIFTVAITPCTSKKYEVTRKELPGTDAVFTTLELIELIQKNLQICVEVINLMHKENLSALL